MALRAGKKASPARAPKKKPIGAVRRSQLITTYGVGSMIALDDQSFIVSGLDSWQVGDKPDLREFRLQTRLGVRGFNLPPFSDPYAGDGVRVRRFPDWYTCPSGDGCRDNLRRFRDFGSKPDKAECGSCGGTLSPSRFVVACENGHLDDFPYWRWLHAGKASRGNGEHHLSFRTTGRTASLRSIVIGCSCGEEASMEGAFGAGAMQAIGHSCAGGRPWLGREAAEQGCDKPVRTLQRGSSAAWFPVVRSALSIPPFSQQLHIDIGPYVKMWMGEGDSTIVRQAEKEGLLGSRYTGKQIVQAVRDFESYEAGERMDPSEFTGFEASDVLRAEEYKQLSLGDETPDFECVAPLPDSSDSTVLGIGAVMQVNRLREVRVLQSFTRVQAPMEGEGKNRLAALTNHDVGWLPGIEVVGEGVFLRLDFDCVRGWESMSGPGAPSLRAERIRGHHQAVLARRAATTGSTVPASTVTARFVLLHTLAHALINEWSLDAGYPAASLRERLYVSDDMAGVLVYTATSDSAGSLGGLVAEGKPSNLRRSLESALQRVSWCSADPLCMEAEASGADSLNLAACHACMLLPETSCETNNSFLDRGMLIGTSNAAQTGYFNFVGGA